MIFLGLMVAALATVAAVGVILDSTAPASLSVFGETVPGINSQWQIFSAGVVLAIVFMTGIMIAFFGIGRAFRVRQELRELRDEHEQSMHTLEMEKRRLQRALEHARSGNGGPPQLPAHNVATSR
ncbi:hypothetical protein ACRYCC_33940 [Actinomadura scrupuli]|uniref:hypothetical protein n=1 Tax=Actinomadura scrupuli TaxID=559629 RepID=UPI003D970D52